MENKKVENVSTEIVDQALKMLEQELKTADVSAVETMKVLLNTQSDLVEQLTYRNTVMQQAIQMLIVADTALEDFRHLGDALILRLQEREIELLRETILEHNGKGVILIKDTIESPIRDTEGNFGPGAHFKGELIWGQMEENGVMVYKATPDALSGISFAKLPILALDAAAALIAFDIDGDPKEPMFRFVSDRIGQGFERNVQQEVIGKFSDFEKLVKFNDKHDAKMEKVLGLMKGMKEVRGFDLVGLNVEETFTRMINKDGKYTDKTKTNLMTNITGIFRREGEASKFEAEGATVGYRGSLTQEEWVLDENQKSKTKFAVRSVSSANTYTAEESEVVNLEFQLKELLKEDRKVLMENYKKSKEENI